MKEWYSNKIDDYIKGLLSKTEQKEFEIELSKNEALQKEVALSKAIVNQYKFEQLKQTISKAKLENEAINEKYRTVSQTIQQAKNENINKKIKTIQFYRRLSIAAVFCLAVGVSLYFTNQNSKTNLLTDIVVKESSLENVTALKTERIENLVITANQAINNEKFSQVLSITDQLRKEAGFETDEILQNECYIYFKQKNYKKAERQLNSIKDLKLKNEVRWKLSQLYLDVGEKALAKNQLLLVNEGVYKKKAAKQLKKIN